MLVEEFVTSDDAAADVGEDVCELPRRSARDMLSSIGDGNPREMISLCSSSSEFMECFCRISGPVSDLAMSGLGKSLKVVCCREGIPSSVCFTLAREFRFVLFGVSRAFGPFADDDDDDSAFCCFVVFAINFYSHESESDRDYQRL